MDAEAKKVTNEYRQSEWNARNEYDLNKICKASGIFLSCEYEIQGELVAITYDIEEKQEYQNIFKENRLTKLKALIAVGEFYRYRTQFLFPITPDNLYYDMYGKVFVKFRDICDESHRFFNESFMKEYKALIGCTLSDKYGYDDYFQGGMDLLKKDRYLAKIVDIEDWDELVSLLKQEAERVSTYNHARKIEVDKGTFKFNRVMTAISFVLILVLVFLGGYYFFWVKPYHQGVIQAQNAYLDLNYTEVVEVLQGISPERLDSHQKYILAVSYVKCENLTEEQKTNILTAVEIQGNEKILDYWISIGRLDIESSKNIAQQISDEQLLVYAYLKEKYILEADTDLSGDEKTARLKTLDDQIQALTKDEGTSSSEDMEE